MTGLAPAVAFLALFAAQCADAPSDPPDPPRSLEEAIAEAVRIAAAEAGVLPRFYFEHPRPDMVRSWGHFGIRLNPVSMARLDEELRTAAGAAARNLATTAPLGFELVNLEAWKRMPGCFPPGLVELREGVPEPRPEGFGGDRLTIASVYPSRRPGGAVSVWVTFRPAPSGCPWEPVPRNRVRLFETVMARPTPEGWEFELLETGLSI